MPEQRVVIQVDLGIQRHQVAAAGDNQGVNLHQRTVVVGEYSAQVAHDACAGLGLSAFQAQLGRQAPGLKGHKAHDRVNDFVMDVLGSGGGNLFDVHATRRAGQKDRASSNPVDGDGEIQLSGYVGQCFDQDVVHRRPFRTGLRGDQTFGQQRVGDLAGFVRGVDNFDASAVAAAPGVYLRLQHGPPIEVRRGFPGFFAAGRQAALRDGNAVTGEDFLGLVFVDPHRRSWLVPSGPPHPPTKAGRLGARDIFMFAGNESNLLDFVLLVK